MKKVFLLFLLLFITFSSTFAQDKIKIISREEWWADESYRFLDSNAWKEIFKDRERKAEIEKNKVYSEASIEKYEKKQEKLKKMDEILLTEYWKDIEIKEKIYEENSKKLAWSIYKTKKINSIIIHHTHTDYDDSFTAVKNIYRYHSLQKEWWDIWYNYLIGKNGEIYEWRAGWDSVVWAHDKWNNRGSVWIAIIWDYSNKSISNKQYNVLKQLSVYLMEKHDIDMTEKVYFHSECFWNKCEKPLFSELKYPIIGHRDAWHTSCPWDKLYAQLDILRKELLKEPFTLAKIYKKKIFKAFDKVWDDKLINILAKVEDNLDKKDSKKMNKVKELVIEYFKTSPQPSPLEERELAANIKIKLSYPDKDKISIKSGRVVFDIKRRWDKITVRWMEFNILKIPKKLKWAILEIISWERKPTWDNENRYNDNKFRGDLYVYSKNNELVVVNSLPIEDYLKWLWEVSNSEVPEKIKTIIIAARSYATWYTTKDRKYPWEFYDWVDDPNRFQKYLWYGLEKRTPNVNKIVDETAWILITYKWELIKPWYFSNSDWQTLSFYDYCKIRYSNEICTKEAKKYPYFQSVVDKWSEWKTKAWHWVWISWAWARYFAEKWWNYDMIIKYFLKGVEVM